MAAKLAEPRDCGFCGEPVPLTRGRRGPVSYCSRRCKEKATVASGKGAENNLRSYYKRRYGLTLDQVAEMRTGACDICGTREWNGRHKNPHIDHDHATGEVRGLLCHNCNLLVGRAKDDPAILKAALKYLA